MRRAPVLLASALAFVALGALVACGDGNDDAAPEPAPTTEPEAPPEPPPEPEQPAIPLAEVAVQLTPVATVSGPTALAVRDGDPALYVTEKAGRVVAVADGDVRAVLDLGGTVSGGFEQGLLGLAFSPDGSRLYVNRTDVAGDTQVDEYAFADGVADPASRRSILSVPQPAANHNGGDLVYGPDGMLWLGLGDGGGAGDTFGQAQDTDTLLGALLRIDPVGGDPYGIPEDNPFTQGGGRPEIWAYGLRNPWRISFDRATGDLWIADVGQNAWEEINLAPVPERGRGSNYGWPHREGTHDFDGGGPDDLVDPVFEYPNPAQGCSITGGYVYRGEAIPDLEGAYLYSDWCQSTIRAIRVEDGLVVDDAVLPAETTGAASFGEGPDGELYVLSLDQGLILRIDPA